MNTREYKHLAFSDIKTFASGRIRTGVAAVFGNIDEYGDRILPGAFTKTIAEGRNRVRHLWNHSYEHPPIASIKELRELGRDELPAEVLAKAPEATGGLLVRREYYDTELSNWILAAIDAGDINEMSFAYDPVQTRIVTEPETFGSEKEREIRELKELKLFDTSDVLWGMNSATIAVGAKNAGLQVLPVGVLASQFCLLSQQIKQGRRNSDTDQKLIDLIHDTAVGLGAVCNPEQNTEISETDNTENAKAEAVINQKSDTSLSSDWLKIRKFEADMACFFEI